MEIVVARYNENLHWLQEIIDTTSQFDLKITIYNKGNTPAIIQFPEHDEKFLDRYRINKSRVRVVQLANVGVCDHTYLHHIVSRYDSLATTTLFVPASAYDDINKRPRLQVLMQSFIFAMKTGQETTSVISIPDIFRDAYVNFSRTKQVDMYECTDARNRDGNQSIRKATIRPFGKWYDAHLKSYLGDAKNVTLKGMFLVGRTKLRERPLEMYTKLLDMVSTHRFPEESHYIERSWHAIINPNSKEEISLLLVVPYIKELIGVILLIVFVLVTLVLHKMEKPKIKL
jgi:hypothetical protein